MEDDGESKKKERRLNFVLYFCGVDDSIEGI